MIKTNLTQQKPKYDALNQAIGERGKLDQSVDEEMDKLLVKIVMV